MSIFIGLVVCGIPLAVMSSLYAQKSNFISYLIYLLKISMIYVEASSNTNSGSTSLSSTLITLFIKLLIFKVYHLQVVVGPVPMTPMVILQQVGID
jgi:hypothetical protein